LNIEQDIEKDIIYCYYNLNYYLNIEQRNRKRRYTARSGILSYGTQGPLLHHSITDVLTTSHLVPSKKMDTGIIYRSSRIRVFQVDN